MSLIVPELLVGDSKLLTKGQEKLLKFSAQHNLHFQSTAQATCFGLIN